MCKWGQSETVEVTIPADLSHTGKERKKKVGIDKCIAPIVRALERGGIKMRGSCCGHGKIDGHIHLQDGRVLVIKQNGNRYMAKLNYGKGESELKGLFEKRIQEKLCVLDEKIQRAKELGDDTAVHSYEDEKKNYDFMLELVAVAQKEIFEVAYSMATIHDIPRLHKVLEKWLGRSKS